MFLTRRKSTIISRVEDADGKKQNVNDVKRGNVGRGGNGAERADAGAAGANGKREDGGGADR